MKNLTKSGIAALIAAAGGAIALISYLVLRGTSLKVSVLLCVLLSIAAGIVYALKGNRLLTYGAYLLCLAGFVCFACVESTTVISALTAVEDVSIDAALLVSFAGFVVAVIAGFAANVLGKPAET